MYCYGYRFWGYWLLISIMLLDDMSAAPPAGQGSPAVTAKFKRDDRCIVMGVDFGVIFASDFDNVIRFYVRRPAAGQRTPAAPPSHQNLKEMTDISVWVLILGLFGSLISIMLLDFTSTTPPARQGSPAGQGSPAAHRHAKI